MKNPSENFLSEKLMKKVNEKIEQELIEYLEEEEKKPEEKTQSSFSFYLTMAIIASVVILYKLGPLLVQLISDTSNSY